jgi:hypothetical protein
MDFCVVWDDKKTSSGICFSGLCLMQGLATGTADDVDVELSEVKTWMISYFNILPKNHFEQLEVF